MTRTLQASPLPACRRLLFPLLHAEKVPFPRATKEIAACNKGNGRRLHAGKLALGTTPHLHLQIKLQRFLKAFNLVGFSKP